MEKLIFLSCVLMGIHWFADFLFQHPWMAKNKSSRLDALALHVSVYSLTFWVLLRVAKATITGEQASLIPQPELFVLVNGFLHFCTDFCTSRLTSYFWSKNKTHSFFATIGADQWVHLMCISCTYALFTNS
jgi:hypothetical protein